MPSRDFLCTGGSHRWPMRRVDGATRAREDTPPHQGVDTGGRSWVGFAVRGCRPAARRSRPVALGRGGAAWLKLLAWLRRMTRRGIMRFLLTSAGIKNASIHDALVELLGKPIAECDALCIPTGLYGHPWAGPRQAWLCISGQERGTPTVGLGWKSVGVLELTALPSLDAERWEPLVRETEVLLVEGGDAAYLCHWLRASGLADLLPSLDDTVWVGVSAGSMVMTPRVGADFVNWH